MREGTQGYLLQLVSGSPQAAPSTSGATWWSLARLLVVATWLLIVTGLSFERGIPRGRRPRPERPAGETPRWKVVVSLVFFFLVLFGLPAALMTVFLVRGT
jgi:TRAP-type mannitol/chloroaromatic compound transport system permease small subunit